MCKAAENFSNFVKSTATKKKRHYGLYFRMIYQDNSNTSLRIACRYSGGGLMAVCVNTPNVNMDILLILQYSNCLACSKLASRDYPASCPVPLGKGSGSYYHALDKQLENIRWGITVQILLDLQWRYVPINSSLVEYGYDTMTHLGI